MTLDELKNWLFEEAVTAAISYTLMDSAPDIDADIRNFSCHHSLGQECAYTNTIKAMGWIEEYMEYYHEHMITM